MLARTYRLHALSTFDECRPTKTTTSIWLSEKSLRKTQVRDRRVTLIVARRRALKLTLPMPPPARRFQANGVYLTRPASAASMCRRAASGKRYSLESAMKTAIPIAPLFVVVLSGCAAQDRVQPLIAAHRCEEARTEVGQMYASNPGLRAAGLAAVYEDCDKSRTDAIRFMQLSARYGNAFAQETLTKWGQPVPAADLAVRPTVIQQGSPLPMACTSRQVFSTVYTDCN